MNPVKTYLSHNIVRKIKQIEIQTKRLLSSALVGDNASAIKGSGFEFDQIREYQVGDDVRTIDWNASARMDKFLVKQFIEERSRTIFLVVDVSMSSLFTTSTIGKKNIIAQIASVLALVSNFGKDCVGLILFSTKVEKYIPSGRGSFHVRRIMELLFTYQSKKSETSISVAYQHLLVLNKKDALVFLISDFIDDTIEQYLPQAVARYDIVAIRCLDIQEKELPSVGFVTVQDIETGDIGVIDMRLSSAQKIRGFLKNRLSTQEKIFKKYGIELLDISQEHDCVGKIIRFFRRRMRY